MTDKTILRLVTAISIFVFAVVVILNRKLIPVTIATPSFVYFLPKLNAIINGTCSVLLLVSLYFIKNKNVNMHKRLNILTFVLSSVFLVSYILFHYFVKETTFGGTGAIRTFYYTILVSHIILVMTSNAGAEQFSRQEIGFKPSLNHAENSEAIKRIFSPEFRNRLDATISFAPAGL